MIIKSENMILDLLVQTDPKGIVKFESEAGIVRMIPFAGTVSGPLFQGIIEPCGVDTQITNAANVRHMSARYMLTGKDNTGADAHIYVENNGWFDNSQPFAMPFRTVPTFYTDSAALAPYLHTTRFTGKGAVEADGLHIYFYELGAAD